jgi:hypothetical protein
MGVVSFTPLLLYRRSSIWYPLYRRLEGLQSHSGPYGKEENFLFLLGIIT